MTLSLIVRWWWLDLRDWWQARRSRPKATYPKGMEGRMVRFSQRGSTMGYMDYTVWARRGRFVIGTLAYRNQWGYYAFYPISGVNERTPLNAEILAEIYAMLKELRFR